MITNKMMDLMNFCGKNKFIDNTNLKYNNQKF